MVEAVRRYEGYVVQSTGDGIFALFGPPVAHEDHPQRALYAALQMQQGLREYEQRLTAQGRPVLKARIEGYFLLKPLGPARIKGVSEPVNVYEVTGLGALRTRLQRAVGRGLTKFVGREREMEALKHAAEQAKGGRGQIVAAMAEPGVSKSRLSSSSRRLPNRVGWCGRPSRFRTARRPPTCQ
jgi:hypothetical protein